MNTKSLTNNENWLNPTNKLLIQRAVRKRASEVTLGDGRKLNLTYLTAPEGKTYAGDLMVKFSPQIGFAPRGEFKVDTILELMWLAFAGDKKEL